jgi:hypothetical protein
MTEKITRHNAHMFTNIIVKTLGCAMVRAAVSSLANTKAANTIIMKAAENAADEYGINCRTNHTDNGMQFTVGSEESIEVSVKVADAAKMEAVNALLETIKDNGMDKEQIQKELLEVVLKQIKK